MRKTPVFSPVFATLSKNRLPYAYLCTIALCHSGTHTHDMARYHELLGRRVEVQYRAGDVVLPATGTLAADSGRSIFLEERLAVRGQAKTFRWEIPYVCILSLAENFAPPPALPKEVAEDDRAQRDSKAAGMAPMRQRPNEA
jgi:hypothetical protein